MARKQIRRRYSDTSRAHYNARPSRLIRNEAGVDIVVNKELKA
jgi:hypothetical protein